MGQGVWAFEPEHLSSAVRQENATARDWIPMCTRPRVRAWRGPSLARRRVRVPHAPRSDAPPASHRLTSFAISTRHRVESRGLPTARLFATTHAAVRGTLHAPRPNRGGGDGSSRASAVADEEGGATWVVSGGSWPRSSRRRGGSRLRAREHSSRNATQCAHLALGSRRHAGPRLHHPLHRRQPKPAPLPPRLPRPARRLGPPPPRSSRSAPHVPCDGGGQGSRGRTPRVPAASSSPRSRSRAATTSCSLRGARRRAGRRADRMRARIGRGARPSRCSRRAQSLPVSVADGLARPLRARHSRRLSDRHAGLSGPRADHRRPGTTKTWTTRGTRGTSGASSSA